MLISCATENGNEDNIKTFEGDILLVSQKKVNDFGAKNYTNVTGNLIIADFDDGIHDITSLNPLNTIKSVDGYLDIVGNDLLTNIDGLSNLTNISLSLIHI